MKKLILFAIIMTGLVACKKSKERPNITDDCSIKDPTTVVAYDFKLTVPGQWKFVKEQGIDTYIGYFQKDNHKISFDYGQLSMSDFDTIKDSEEFLYFKKTTINGSKAKIVKEKSSGGILLTAFIDKGDKNPKIRLYTFDTTMDCEYVKIFKSFEFQ